MARGPQFADLGCGGPWTKDWMIRHCETWAQKRKVVQIVSLNLEGDCFQGVCVCVCVCVCVFNSSDPIM